MPVPTNKWTEYLTTIAAFLAIMWIARAVHDDAGAVLGITKDLARDCSL